MAEGKLGIYPGRDKIVPFTWRTGSSQSSPPVDCTGAVCAVFSSNLPEGAVTINPVNEALGEYALNFIGQYTQMLRSGNSSKIRVSLTWPSPNTGYSPDPVTVEIFIR